jgi:hypothetical protein
MAILTVDSPKMGALAPDQVLFCITVNAGIDLFSANRAFNYGTLVRHGIKEHGNLLTVVMEENGNFALVSFDDSLEMVTSSGAFSGFLIIGDIAADRADYTNIPVHLALLLSFERDLYLIL